MERWYRQIPDVDRRNGTCLTAVLELTRAHMAVSWHAVVKTSQMACAGHAVALPLFHGCGALPLNQIALPFETYSIDLADPNVTKLTITATLPLPKPVFSLLSLQLRETSLEGSSNPRCIHCASRVQNPSQDDHDALNTGFILFRFVMHSSRNLIIVSATLNFTNVSLSFEI